MLKIGQMAPKFKIKNQKEEEISLIDFKGKKVLLYFYPKALTPGCTTQAQCLRDSKKKFEKLDYVILGISADLPAKLAKFVEKEKLNFDLLSDVDHEICEKYGVWGLKKFMGKEFMVINRTTFFIDESGKIENILTSVKTKTHHLDALGLISE